MYTLQGTHLLGFAFFCWTLASVGRCGPPSGPAAGGDEAAYALMHRALQFQSAGMYRTAVAEWQKFLQLHSKHKEAHNAVLNLGLSLYELKYDTAVIEVLSGFRRAYPQSENVPDAVMLLARSRERLADRGRGTFLDAAVTYSEVFDLAPYGDLASRALYGQANCLYKAGRFEQARVSTDRLLQSWKSDEMAPNACLLSGRIALELKENDAACKAFEQVTVGWPKHEIAPYAHYYLGKIRLDEKKYAEAARHFQTASERNGFKSADIALLMCGDALEQGGSAGLAAEAFRSFHRRFPRSKYATYAQERYKRLAESSLVEERTSEAGAQGPGR